MIQSTENLNDQISSCTQNLENKLSGKDGKRHIILCGGTGCLSNNSKEIQEKFQTLLAEKGLTEQVSVNQSG